MTSRPIKTWGNKNTFNDNFFHHQYHHHRHHHHHHHHHHQHHCYYYHSLLQWIPVALGSPLKGLDATKMHTNKRGDLCQITSSTIAIARFRPGAESGSTGETGMCTFLSLLVDAPMRLRPRTSLTLACNFTVNFNRSKGQIYTLNVDCKL